jgi:putative oxidoreductase
MTIIGKSVSRADRPAARIDLGQLPVLRQGAGVLSAVRIIVSFLFACHGAKILFGILGGVDQHGATAPIGSWPIWWAGVIELLGGALVLIGLFTRPAALLCSGAMAFAYFTVHQPQALLPLQNHGELATLYCWIFLLIATLGPGWFALDAMRRQPQAAQKLPD